MRVLRNTALFAALAGAVVSQVWAQRPQGKSGAPSTPQAARSWVQEAMSAMGGEARLRAIKTTRFESYGHWHMLEQSERPEWPWIVSYERSTEAHDYNRNALWQETEGRSLGNPEGGKAAMMIADGVAQIEVGGQKRPFGMAQVEDAEEWLAMTPERILLLAADASDLRAEADTTYHEVPHRVVTFGWKPNANGAAVPVRVFLNAWTKLPSAVEWRRALPYDNFWRVWGDFPQRLVYTAWSLQPGGIRYPVQWDLERDGKPYHMRTLYKVELNPALPAELFTISEDVRKAFEQRKPMMLAGPALGKPQPIIQGHDDIVQFVGAWNSAIIRQPDGLVMLESPIGPPFSQAMMAEAKKRFPGMPIKALITTSDAYPHFAGVREYVAAGVPVYATDLNKATLTKAVNAPFKQVPDTLASNPRAANFNWVSKKTVIGVGANRLELYPIRNASGERMMMVYFPEYKLLYGSDLIQRMPNGTFFFPAYLRELSDAVQREGLAVEKVFAMHSTVLPWTEVTAALAKIEKEGGPNPAASGESDSAAQTKWQR